MAVVKTSTVYLVIIFIFISVVLLSMLPSYQREGMKTRKTPPLSAEASMKQVKEGTKAMGSDGYRKSITDRIGKLEQTYPDIPDDS
uniref:Uncharacterized protein n=1 Tax=viral metagenome TaxID=1070528 RepID=A0A6C0AIV3_9ZZZZ